jgi:hypothetical protein
MFSVTYMSHAPELSTGDSRPIVAFSRFYEFIPLNDSGMIRAKRSRAARLGSDLTDAQVQPDRWNEAIPINCYSWLDGFRKGLNPSYALRPTARFWRQPWRECGVTGRITPTGVVGGFVKPKLPNPL